MKTSVSCILLLVVAVTLRASAAGAFFVPNVPAAPSVATVGLQNVTVLSCQSDSCAKGTCTSSSVPSGVCQSGYSFRCASSLSQCLSLQSYQARDSCPAAELLGATGMMCDFCYRLINETSDDGKTINFIMRNCRSDQSRTLFEDCDDLCTNCGKKTKIVRNTCYPFPGSSDEGSMIVTSVMPCNKVVFVDSFNTLNCSGALAMKSVIPANLCIGGGANQTSEYVC